MNTENLTLTPDPRNANRGTERGAWQLEESLRQYGAGRSILVDRNGVVIAGNKTLEQAVSLGLDVEVVHTDGTKIVAVCRDDLDLETDPRARELAIADNRVGQLDLDWDPDELRREIEEGIDLSRFFLDHELKTLLEIHDDVHDHEKAWDGMPEFGQEHMAKQRIVVSFTSHEDALEFGDLLGQQVTSKTRALWYPARPDVPEIEIDEP
jgi:hypothetical protein